ncbi:MAG: winged helix-turn-helix transcriptional regulator [Myxococcales bacterium]|nr:winged helix-turn-helix transcriptional regulator [Myxococcales bacterium]MDD9970853.1 winged helix-turn-helix transcriptional regulator [Myxococcales bacterium]
MKYGQFCPIAKASEVLGERWMLLVLRELVSGATRYAELQRGLGRISPSVLSSRLKTLMDHGIIERVQADKGNGWAYRLTDSGVELAPIIESIGVWGQRWTRSRMTRDELDVELLMLHLRRSFDASAFAQAHGVVSVVFGDLHGETRRWWLLVDDGEVELCVQPPGRPEDVTLTCRLKTLTEVFVGDCTLKEAIGAGRLEIKGAGKLTRNVHNWLLPSALAEVPPAAHAS